MLVNDTDADGLALQRSAFQRLDRARRLVVTLNTDGSFSYIPADDFWGMDSFTYTATDGQAVSQPATVTITVYSLPVANADAYSIKAGATLSVAAPGVLANDTNADDGALERGASSNPANGTLALNPDGSFSYTPNAGFFGTDSFSYSATDGHATSVPTTVTITINAVPIANRTAFHAGNTTLTATSVLADDTDTNPNIQLTRNCARNRVTAR